MKIRSAKNKGKLFEKEIADKIKECFSLTVDDIRVTVGSETGADIKLSAKAKSVFPFSLELKRRASFKGIYDFYKQASNHYKELIPAVIIRQDRSEPLIILDLDNFLTLINKDLDN